MAKLRSLNTEIWSDTWFEELPPTEKLLFIYLITNNKTNMLGIYEASIKRISFDTGIKKETVLNALKGFERVKKVKYKENHIVLVNYLKHQNYNPNMMKSAIKIFNELPKHFNYQTITLEKSANKETVINCFVTLSKRLGMVRKVEVLEDEIEDEIEVYNKKNRFNFRKELINLGIEENIVKEWLQVRKNKKATNSETAFKKIKKEITKSGLSPNEAIKNAVENSWSGFNSEWIKNLNSKQQEPSKSVLFSMDKFAEIIQEGN